MYRNGCEASGLGFDCSGRFLEASDLIFKLLWDAPVGVGFKVEVALRREASGSRFRLLRNALGGVGFKV